VLGLILSIIAFLSFLGLWIAIYMVLGYYAVEPLFTQISGMMPPSIRLNTKIGLEFIQHPSGTFFGLPNSAYGILYYLLVLLSVVTQSDILLWLARWAAVVSLLLSAFLVYMQMRRLRRPCLLCHLANLINGVLAALIWNIPLF